ncbi:Tfp pilus assembly protein FimT/FimU [Burkholderiaceae bacterium UC74_6]
MQLMRPDRVARGFTLIELMVTLAIASVLAAVAMPAFRTWIANAKVRAATESVASQVRLAQAEAVKRYRRVVLYRAAASSSCPGTIPTYSANGSAWIIKTIPLYTGDTEEVVQCGNLSDSTTDVTVTPGVACFGTNGWPIALASGVTGAGVACTVSTSGTVTFSATSSTSAGDRPLQITVGLAGAVRMCDPSKTYSASNPDGCPP